MKALILSYVNAGEIPTWYESANQYLIAILSNLNKETVQTCLL